MARATLRDLFAAALAALDPTRLLARVLERRGDVLVVHAPRSRRPVPTPVRLPLGSGLLVVGAGKGAGALAAAVEEALGAAVVAGLVIVPAGYERPLRRITLAIGSHPTPDGRSVRATARLLAVVDSAPALPVLVLLTGGASSLLVAPAPGLTVADKRRTGALLLASGAAIAEMNAVRKHLSDVKGGRLAERLRGRAAAALVVSDVPGDDLAVIGSGPTVADPTTFADAHRILASHRLIERVPRAVVRHLERGVAGAVPETPKSGRAAGRSLPTVLLADNATARAGAARAARCGGIARVVVVRAPVIGPTDAAAHAFATRILRCQTGLRGARRALIVAGGETTVALGARSGRGGRNQEFALAVARVLAGRSGWALLSAGTDGVDGPTPAAGAFADATTIARAGRLGRSVDAVLARHDVFPLLSALGDLYAPGPTGTNVGDLKLALVWRESRWRRAERA